MSHNLSLSRSPSEYYDHQELTVLWYYASLNNTHLTNLNLTASRVYIRSIPSKEKAFARFVKQSQEVM